MNLIQTKLHSAPFVMPPILTALSFVLIATTISGCGKQKKKAAPTSSSLCNGGKGIPTAKAEIAYCPTIPLQTFSSPITLTGRAVYQFRDLTASGLQAVNSTARTIRYAEVRVTNSAGTLVQCAETANDGTFSFTLPTDSSTYSVSVMTRGFNSNIKASVMSHPEQATLLSVSTTVVADSTKNMGTLTASATGDLVGGAFNILDQILKANEFLASQTLGCSSFSSGCQAYSPAVKVSVYWAKGFNPACYFGSGQSGLSFFSPTTNQLFILGGIDGDTNSSDTDHFDNSVILHEYGHFLETNYGNTDSPGGSHNGDSIIDPRLAWSEGWADYFQSAVTGSSLYRDSYGNVDGTTGLFFNLDLNTCGAVCSDKPINSGEGNFREFSIARLLWDALDPHPVTGQGTGSPSSPVGADNLTAGFNEIWAAFTQLSQSNYAFRNIGLLHERLQAGTGASDFSSLRVGEKQGGNRKEYANPTIVGGSCTNTGSLTGVRVTCGPHNSAGCSSISDDLLQNHDFYHYSHPGGAVNLTLTFSGTATPDLDLYIYKDDHVLFDTTTIAAASEGTTTNGATSGSESISVSLAAGNYLIDVSHYYVTSSLGPISYTLTLGGSKICPTF